MRRIVISRVLGYALFLLIIGCGGAEAVTPTPVPKYTVMIYMVGSDLESKNAAGSTDLTEMKQVGSNENLKVVVETGGANKDGWRTVKRRLINQGSETEISDLGNLNMGAPNTLQDFVTWSVATYPADKYMLIMWDHGGGPIGKPTIENPTPETFGNDENNNKDGLSLPEIKQAIQNAYNTTGKKFDVIGFDACLMATLEVAHNMSSFGRYLVASEDLEPGYGWDYTAILSTIKSNTSITGSALGQAIADGYNAHAKANDTGKDGITLSVMDMSFIPNVVAALDALANRAGTDLQNIGQSARVTIANGRSKAEDYGNSKGGSFDLADLKHIANNLTSTYSTEANALIAAINQAVVYKVNGVSRPNSNGISIFLPSENLNTPNMANMLQAYNNIDFSATYKGFISQYSGLGDMDDTAPTFASETLSGNVYTAHVQGDDIDNVYAVISQRDPATGTILIIGLDSVDVNASGDVSYTWDGTWVTMNGSFVSLNLDDEEGDISTYTIPALLNGEGVDIMVMVNSTTGDYAILGAWPGIVNGIAVREIIQIKQGDVITPLFTSYNLNTDEEQYVQGTPFTVGAGGVDLSITALPPGTYQLGFIAEDYAQNVENSQFVASIVP